MNVEYMYNVNALYNTLMDTTDQVMEKIVTLQHKNETEYVAYLNEISNYMTVAHYMQDKHVHLPRPLYVWDEVRIVNTMLKHANKHGFSLSAAQAICNVLARAFTFCKDAKEIHGFEHFLVRLSKCTFEKEQTYSLVKEMIASLIRRAFDRYALVTTLSPIAFEALMKIVKEMPYHANEEVYKDAVSLIVGIHMKTHANDVIAQQHAYDAMTKMGLGNQKDYETYMNNP